MNDWVGGYLGLRRGLTDICGKELCLHLYHLKPFSDIKYNST